jgi:uncharacterized membrane protein
MKTDRLVVLSFVLLVFGVVWLASHWNGSIGFGFSYPLAGSNFHMNVTDQGSAAVVGLFVTVLGALLFVITFVQSILNLAEGMKR